MVRLLLILSILLTYTVFKAMQLFPEHEAMTSYASLPLFALMLAAPMISRAGRAVHEASWYRALVWASSLTMGFWSVYIFLSIPADLISLLLFPFMNAFKYSAGISQTILAITVISFFVGLFEALRRPAIKKVMVPFANLPHDLQNLRIAQISDLHVGPTIRKKYVEGVVSQVNSIEPDLIVITGDIADASADSIQNDLLPLAGMRARYGIFYVTGNHEYYWGVEKLVACLTRLGIRPLINESQIVKIGQTELLIAGVTDPMGHRHSENHKPNMKRATQGTRADQFKILLAHRPDACDEGEQLGFDLQFSGHTHSGQYFPFNLLIVFFHKYYRGLNRHGNLWVYVNPGTGYWGPANRFGVSSEITHVELSAK